MATPAPTRSLRGPRSAREPNTGLASMYTMMNAESGKAVCWSVNPRSFLKRSFTADGTQRST